MASSLLGNKIQSLQARLRAENKANKNDVFPKEGENPFAAARPGSGRSRPNILGDVNSQTRTRRKFDLPGSNPVEPSSTDPVEVDSKIKEIMKLTGIICINNKKYPTDINSLKHLGELGNGTCGHVVKMLHEQSQSIIAVKQMRRSGILEENKRIIMDLEVVLKSHDCDYIVRCLGCFITDADVWICMELMATCFDKLLKRLSSPVPEEILGKVSLATVKALNYLKEKHGVIHRDIKPSNILLDEKGNVKLCDFGISGRLVDSKAKTQNAGCAAYMAPERIAPPDPGKPDYDIRADVWSLGITLVELATGIFPYPNCESDFEVLTRVVQDDPPSLPSNHFSPEFQDFVKCCLAKDYKLRPKYKKLLEHPFLRRYETKHVDVAAWFARATQTSRTNPPVQTRKRSILLRSLSDKGKSNDVGSEITDSFGFKAEVKPQVPPPHKPECEGLKGVWNSILRSPLFRRKKSTDNTPLTQSAESNTHTPSSGNISPLVLQRFIHQQIQHMNGFHRTHRSTSVSPTRRYPEAKVFDEGVSGLRVGVGTPRSRINPSPSPEPPPRINKMVSPLLMRRIAYNNLPPSEIPHNTLFSPSPCLPRRFGYGGIPPQPPPRRKSTESHSVPCSPVPYHRVPAHPRAHWQHSDLFNTSH